MKGYLLVSGAAECWCGFGWRLVGGSWAADGFVLMVGMMRRALMDVSCVCSVYHGLVTQCFSLTCVRARIRVVSDETQPGRWQPLSRISTCACASLGLEALIPSRI